VRVTGKRKSKAKEPVGEVIGPLSLVEEWFRKQGWKPWPFQRETWQHYLAGRSGLVQVATGAGKTYAAYLGPLAELVAEMTAAGGGGDGAGIASKGGVKLKGGGKGLGEGGLRILYITPLRAVSRDIELALKAPAAELCPGILIESRTGDTKQSVRAKQRTRLPHVLVTTPESLCLLLTREDAGALLSGILCVIIDEWHELLSSKRGTQVELALARLRVFSPSMRTWALSATIANVEQAARAAVGTGDAGDAGGAGVRAELSAPIVVVAPMEREVVVDSVIPKDLRRLPLAGHLGMQMVPDVVEALDPPTTSTLVFTNTRSQAERWFHAILVEKPEWAGIMALHHGSIDREEREQVEAGLKSGSLKIVVATSSLDLGVDFSPVARVMQIGSPKGIGRLMQRAGRASHRPMTPCRVTCVPTHGLQLFEVDAARRAVARGDVEARTPASKPLDVLAQHMVTCGLGGGFIAEELYAEVRGAWAYRDLTWEEFAWALALVEHGGGTLRAYKDYHRVMPVDGRYRVVNKQIAQMHRLNVGTIVSDTTIEIKYLNGRTLGRIEEHFVANLKVNEKFVFAGKTVSYVFMRELTAFVKPARGQTTHTPIWGGTKLPISESLAESIREAMELAEGGKVESPELQAAAGIIATQKRLSRVPRRDEVLVEHGESRDGRHCFVFPFDGRLVHGGVAALLSYRMARERAGTFSISVNDYGFELLSAGAYPFEKLVRPELFSTTGLVDDVVASMNMSELAKLQFREVARVSGLVMQSYPGVFKTARQSQANAGLLFDVLSEFDPGNLLLHQARREVMEKHFEQSRLMRCLKRIGESKLVHVHTERFTPLSFPLVIERQAAKVSNQTILERVEEARAAWGI